MNGGTFSGIAGGRCDVVWTALTGMNAIQTVVLGKTHNEILQIIDDATNAGKIVCVGTELQPNAVTGITGLPNGAHAYYLTGSSINDYKLINPWGDKVDLSTNPPTVISQDVMLQNLKLQNGNTDLSQYITCVYILDPIY